VPELRVAFWNVENLFHPDAGVERGPKSLAELDLKIQALVQVIGTMVEGQRPHLLGLIEVGDQEVFDRLRAAIDPAWIGVWESPGTKSQTGLGLMADSTRVKGLEIIAVDRPSILSKPRAMIVECELNELDPLVVAVTHWKSRMQSGGVDDNADRNESGRWLGEQLSTRYSSAHCILVGGDFNAEPFEGPFLESALRAKRHHSSILHSQATAAYLYNTGWRCLAEPVHWEDTQVNGFVPTASITTHGNGAGLVFDHIMVSKRLLRGGPLRLKEATAKIVASPAIRGPGAKIFPLKWKHDSVAGTTAGLSDHFPVVAVLE
jgi:endonuclease/exonuclease/phosphatase family metal-dependent hydrolase